MRYLDDFSDYDGIAEYWASIEDGPEAIHDYLQALDAYLNEMESQSLADDFEELDLSEDSDLF